MPWSPRRIVSGVRALIGDVNRPSSCDANAAQLNLRAPMPEMAHREVLSTPRLVLRATAAADVAPLHERIFSDAEVIRFVFSGKRFTAAESEVFVRERFNFAGADVGLSTLEERGTGEVIGFAGLIACAALGREDLELGFVLARQAWGKGYATEIGRAQIDFGLDRLGRKRLLALVHPENAPSIGVLAKLGMRREADVTIEGRGQRNVYSIGESST